MFDHPGRFSVDASRAARLRQVSAWKTGRYYVHIRQGRQGLDVVVQRNARKVVF